MLDGPALHEEEHTPGCLQFLLVVVSLCSFLFTVGKVLKRLSNLSDKQPSAKLGEGKWARPTASTPSPRSSLSR